MERPLRPSFFAALASLRRCASVYRMRRPRSCSRKTAFSASKYSVTACWLRVIQPATVMSRNCNGKLDMAERYTALVEPPSPNALHDHSPSFAEAGRSHFFARR
jgi:hypothetical protein